MEAAGCGLHPTFFTLVILLKTICARYLIFLTKYWGLTLECSTFASMQQKCMENHSHRVQPALFSGAGKGEAIPYIC